MWRSLDLLRGDCGLVEASAGCLTLIRYSLPRRLPRAGICYARIRCTTIAPRASPRSVEFSATEQEDIDSCRRSAGGFFLSGEIEFTGNAIYERIRKVHEDAEREAAARTLGQAPAPPLSGRPGRGGGRCGGNTALAAALTELRKRRRDHASPSLTLRAIAPRILSLRPAPVRCVCLCYMR